MRGRSLVWLVFAFLSQVWAAPCPSDSTQLGQLTPEGFCICPSGSFNLLPGNCEGSLSGGNSCDFELIQGLNTTQVGHVDAEKSLVGNNQVQLVLLSPFFQDRLVKKIVVNRDIPECKYPGSFVKSLNENECADEFTGVFSVPVLVNNCSLTAGSSGNFKTYSGSLFMEVVDSLGSIRGIPLFRTTKAFLRFSLLLPTSFTVKVLNEFVMLAPYLQAAVTQQKFDLISHPVISVQVVGSLQYPYQIQGATMTGPAGISGALTGMDSSKCASSTLGSSCFQRFNFDVQATSGIQCNLTGVYTVHFAVTCRTAPALCPLLTETGASFVFTLISPQFCTPVELDVHLTQTVTGYLDAGRTNQKNAFLEGQRAYFFVDLTSTVTLDSLEIHSVTFENGDPESNDTATPLFLAGKGSPLMSSTNFQLISVNSTTIGFSFLLKVNQDNETFDASLFLYDSWSTDFFLMRLNIWVGVHYPISFNDGKKKKRAGFLGEDQVLVKTNLVIERAGREGGDGGVGANSAAGHVVNASLLLAMMMLLLLRDWVV